MSRIGFNTFALFANFIHEHQLSKHVIIDLFEVLDAIGEILI
jgi:hypothetical protein